MPLFCISILILRIGLRLVDLNNYLVILYKFKISTLLCINLRSVDLNNYLVVEYMFKISRPK